MWDLAWAGTPLSRPETAPERISMRRDARKRHRMSAKTLNRLSTIPQHRQRLAATSELSRMVRPTGAADLPAINDLLATPLLEKAESARRNSTSGRTMEEGSLVRIFRWLDTNGDGYVDVDELHAGQLTVQGHLTKQDVADLLWEVDDDMDGRLSLEDFIGAFYRSQKDTTGFEPRRFYFMVEFFLMDRDLSGEITIDEAMSTIFQRFGSDGLARITGEFFAAAGYSRDGDGGEPPPGAIVTFDAFFKKFGLTKPPVRSPAQLGRSYSERALPVIAEQQAQAQRRAEERRLTLGEQGGGERRDSAAESRAASRSCRFAAPFWAPSWDGEERCGRPTGSETGGARRASSQRPSCSGGGALSPGAALMGGLPAQPAASQPLRSSGPSSASICSSASQPLRPSDSQPLRSGTNGTPGWMTPEALAASARLSAAMSAGGLRHSASAGVLDERPRVHVRRSPRLPAVRGHLAPLA